MLKMLIALAFALLAFAFATVQCLPFGITAWAMASSRSDAGRSSAPRFRVCANRTAMLDVARRLYRSPPPRRESDAAPASAAASSGDLGEGSLEASGTSWRDENSEDRSVPSSILYAFTAVAGFDHDRQPVDANLLRCRFRDRVYDFVTSGGIALLNEFEKPTSRKPGGMLLGPAHAGVVPKRPGEVQNVGDTWADAGNWTYALVVRGVHIVDQLLRQQGLEPPAGELHWRIQSYGEGRRGIESLGDVVESVLAVGGSTYIKPGAVRIVPKPADEDQPPQKKTPCRSTSDQFRGLASEQVPSAAESLACHWCCSRFGSDLAGHGPQDIARVCSATTGQLYAASSSRPRKP